MPTDLLSNAKYLDPKNDLTFRKIFGENPKIMKSFLNSVLPLDKEQKIVEITYLDPGLLPVLPQLKHSIVDVRCTDNYDRQFIVEMQMYWTTSFRSRMLFNASKAYVKQLKKGNKYSSLNPVYGLSLISDIYLSDEKYKKQYYHHYRLAHIDNPDEVIKGIELIFIELPKFKAMTFTEKKLQVLWLRFLTEIDENTEDIPEELKENEAISEAIEQLQVSAFSPEELAYYEEYWDRVRMEKTAIEDAQKEAAEAKQREEEAKQREEEARRVAEQERKEKEKIKEQLIQTVKKMKSDGLPIEIISKYTGLTEAEIKKI